LGVFICLRVFLGGIAQLSQTFLGSGSNKVCQHIVDAALRIDKILIMLALYLNFATHNALNHVNGFFVVAGFLLHRLLLFKAIEGSVLQVEGIPTFQRLIDLIGLYVLH
jgi:hypothetical protein